MIPGFHGLDLIVILVIALLVFGPKKLPEMGAAVGKSIKEFRKGMSELTAHKEEETKTPSASTYEAIEREASNHQPISTVREEATRTETPIE